MEVARKLLLNKIKLLLVTAFIFWAIPLIYGTEIEVAQISSGFDW